MKFSHSSPGIDFDIRLTEPACVGDAHSAVSTKKSGSVIKSFFAYIFSFILLKFACASSSSLAKKVVIGARKDARDEHRMIGSSTKVR